jgi:uncharacterized membrane protein
MLSLALVASLLAVSPPALPDEAAPVEGPAPAETTVESPAPVEVAESPAPVEDAIVIAPIAPIEEGALPLAPELGGPPVADGHSIVVVDGTGTNHNVPLGLHMQAVPKPPWSGAGRFVGGAVSLAGGIGLLIAGSLEFANGYDTTKPLISQFPAGIVMLVAGGTMIGTAARDQRTLSEWEAATKIDAKPMGTGMIVGGVTAVALGSMAGVATSIAVDMGLDAPRSIPAGWATTGIGIAGGTALLIAGVVRRVNYGKWRNRITGMPMVAPTRAGATIGFVGQF